MLTTNLNARRSNLPLSPFMAFHFAAKDMSTSSQADGRSHRAISMLGVLAWVFPAMVLSGCGTLASIGGAGVASREVLRRGEEPISREFMISADHGRGWSRDMKYVRRAANRDQRIGIHRMRANFYDLSVLKGTEGNNGIWRFGPVLAWSETAFAASVDDQTLSASSESIMIGGEIWWTPTQEQAVGLYMRLLGGPTRVRIPQLEQDENLGRSDFRGASTRISLGLQYQPWTWLSLRSGIALDTTALPADGHLNDSLGLSMVNSLQGITPHIGVNLRFPFW